MTRTQADAVDAWLTFTDEERWSAIAKLDDTEGTGFDPECASCAARRVLHAFAKPAGEDEE